MACSATYELVGGVALSAASAWLAPVANLSLRPVSPTVGAALVNAGDVSQYPMFFSLPSIIGRVVSEILSFL